MRSNILLLLFLTNWVYAQTVQTYPKNFRWPIDITPALSGSFGELRANHFHSGLDFRTNQREGYPVYAVADGYISRLRVQIGGFGNAVYITHPNGYASVYAHLQRYSAKIAQYIKSYQYRKQSYDVDFPLLPLEIPVKEGEIIAWSGNTGSSGGPHLHFELRDSQTDETINPQLFGLTIPDNIKPEITGLYLYRTSGLPFSERTPKQYFQVSGAGGVYRLNKNPVINLNGEVGFGIIAFDRSIGSVNRNGIYSMLLQLDGKTIYEAVWDRFRFQDSRGINAHVDYPAFLSSGKKIQKSFIEPGNPVGIYKAAVNRGLINLNDANIHELKYIIKDFKGNTSTLSFSVKNNPEAELATIEMPSTTRFYYNKDNEYATNRFKIQISKHALYSDLNFTYSESSMKGTYSAMHIVHNRFTPVHVPYSIWIKTDTNLTPNLQSKAIVVNHQGVSYGGSYENGWVKATPKVFGNFYVAVDTVPPVIKPVNITKGKSMSALNKITCKISDALSGIKSFTGSIDGKWILIEYDPRNGSAWHTFDDMTQPGKHTFELVVTDMKGNSSTYKAEFIR